MKLNRRKKGYVIDALGNPFRPSKRYNSFFRSLAKRNPRFKKYIKT